ncbi:acyl-CoA thioesterase [candidate division KSB1 bacterium]|nr:acyl-CoA thioesterase [candidate division KSB1 bacterium]
MRTESAKTHRPLLVDHAIQIRTYDIDFMGVVSNIVYLRWLEDMRLLFLEQWCPIQEQLDEHITPVLTRTEIDYILPLKMNDKPFAQMWLKNMTRVRFSLEAEISANGKIVMHAIQHGTYLTMKNLRPVPVPTKLRNRYTNWLTAHKKE